MQLPLQHLIKWSRLMQWSDLHFTISAWDYFKSKEKCVLKGAFHNRQNFTSTSVRVVRWWLLTFCFENWGTINWDMTQAQKNAQRDNHYSANESKRNKSSVTSHSRCYSAATNGCLTSFDALPWICNDMLTSTAHMAMSPFAQMTTLCSWIEERELEIQTVGTHIENVRAELDAFMQVMSALRQNNGMLHKYTNGEFWTKKYEESKSDFRMRQ